jgi:putative membrane protein
MRQRFMLGTAVIAGALMSLAVASAVAHEGAKATHPDKHFLKEAAQGGEAEVTLGQMAAKQAANDDVKKFGQRMVDDHTKASDELKKLAASQGVTLPPEMDRKAKAVQQRLSQLSGAEFDRAYMKEMVKDHQKDVAAFEREARQGNDPDLKNWAAQTLPTLKEHLDLAQNTAEKVGAKVSAKSELSAKKAM